MIFDKNQEHPPSEYNKTRSQKKPLKIEHLKWVSQKPLKIEQRDSN